MPLLPNPMHEDLDDIFSKKVTLEEIREKYYADIDPDIFDNIMLEDPTYAHGSNQIGRFGKQLIQWWRNNPSDFETKGKWKSLLGAILEMEEKKILPPGFQINKYRTGEDLADAISPEAEEIRKVVAPFDPTEDKRYTRVLAQIYKAQGKDSFPEEPTRYTGFYGWKETLALYDKLREKPEITRDTTIAEFKLKVALALGKQNDGHFRIVCTEPTLTVHTKSKFANEAFGVGAKWCTTWEMTTYWQKYTADKGVLLQFMEWKGSVEESVLQDKIKYQLFIDEEYKRVEMENQVKTAVETDAIHDKVKSFGVEDAVSSYVESEMGRSLPDIMDKAQGVNDGDDYDNEYGEDEITEYIRVSSDNRYSTVTVAWGRTAGYDEWDDGSYDIELYEADFRETDRRYNPLLMLPVKVAKELNINPMVVSCITRDSLEGLIEGMRNNGFDFNAVGNYTGQDSFRDINDDGFVVVIPGNTLSADNVGRHSLLSREEIGELRKSDITGDYYWIGRAVADSTFASFPLSMVGNYAVEDIPEEAISPYLEAFGKEVSELMSEGNEEKLEKLFRNNVSLELGTEGVEKIAHVYTSFGPQRLRIATLGYSEIVDTHTGRASRESSELQVSARRFNAQDDTKVGIRFSRAGYLSFPGSWNDSWKAARRESVAKAIWNLTRDYDYALVGREFRSGITEGLFAAVTSLGGFSDRGEFTPKFPASDGWLRVTDKVSPKGTPPESVQPTLFATYRKGLHDNDLAYAIYRSLSTERIAAYAAAVVAEIIEFKSGYFSGQEKFDPATLLIGWYRYISGIPEKYVRENPRATAEEKANVNNYAHRLFHNEDFVDLFSQELKKWGVDVPVDAPKETA